MKKIFPLLILTCFLSFSQNQTRNYRFQSIPTYVNFKPIVAPINTIEPYNKILTIYNSTTKLSESYYCLGKTYELSSSNIYPFQNVSISKIDSFNPSGTKDFGSALLFGAITFILEKI